MQSPFPKLIETFFFTDLSLCSPKNYNFMNMGSQVAYSETFFLEFLAKTYPGRLSLSHYYLGLVIRENFYRWREIAWLV
jgi:hypothetical protein